MKILGLDPSSKCTGYAVLNGLEPHDLVEAGRLKPSRAKAVVEHMPAWQAAHYRENVRANAYGVLSMIPDLAGVIREHAPTRIIIEIPSGQAGSGMKKGAAPGSLGVMGMAQGAMYGWLLARFPALLCPVDERYWTRAVGHTKKEDRQYKADTMYSGYDAAQDPGADASDAIWLARYGHMMVEKEATPV